MLVVVVFHAGLPVPGGFIGVDVFFVISGFVITRMLAAEWEARGRIDLRRFYVRRFQRLVPALALVVVVTVALSLVLLSPSGTQQNAAWTGLGAMLFSANAVIASITGGYFDLPARTNPLLNTWSLAIEEQFYVLFPALLALGWSAARRGIRIRTAMLVAILTATSLAFLLLPWRAWFPTYSGLFGFYSPLTRAWEFGAGALLALLAPRYLRLNRAGANVAGGSGVILMVIGLVMIRETTPFPGWWTFVPVLATVLLIAAGGGRDGLVTRALSWKWLTRIGDYSYSIYLWHWPAIVFAALLWPASKLAAPAAVLISLVPAILSFHLLEDPLRRRAWIGRRQFARLALLAGGMPLAAAAGLLLAANAGFWIPAVQQYQAAVMTPTAGFTSYCFVRHVPPLKTIDECWWNATAPERPIYLLGDSNADQFTDALIEVSLSSRRSLLSFTKPSCPFFDVYLRNALIPDPVQAIGTMMDCREHFERTFAWVSRQRAGTVVIGTSDTYWTFPGGLIGDSPQTLTSDPARSNAELSAGLRRTILALEAAGHDVVVPQAVPIFYYPHVWPVSACTVATIMRQQCRASMPLQFSLDRQKPAHEGTRAAVAGTRARLVDFSDALCPQGMCGVAPDISWTVDGYHISVPTARRLALQFAAALAR